jgi:hypothetical protein
LGLLSSPCTVEVWHDEEFRNLVLIDSVNLDQF